MKRLLVILLAGLELAAAAGTVTVASNGVVTAKGAAAVCTFRLQSSGTKVHVVCSASGTSAAIVQDITPALTGTASGGAGNFQIFGDQLGWVVSRLSSSKVRYQISANGAVKASTF